MTTARTWIVNTLTAAAVSVAAITSGAGPAAADDKDMLRALAGIAAVAVIAGAIQNQNRAPQPVTRAPVYEQPKPAVNFYNAEPRWQAERDWENQRDWQRHDDRYSRVSQGPRLPGTCAVEVSGPRPATYYAETCLKREGVGYGLPQYCAQSIRSRDWQGRVYEEECLRDAGYRVGRW